MTPLEHALAFAQKGFYLFPLRPNSKLPQHVGWQQEATRDETKLRAWFASGRANLGIYTGRFGDDGALIVVDEDVKGGKHGDRELLKLELQGQSFPVTLEHSTPSDGRHLVYATNKAVRQGADVLGPGLDIRSKGGYIVAPGSTLDGKVYAQINGHSTLAEAPEWLVTRLGGGQSRLPAAGHRVHGVDPARARERAVRLLTEAVPAVEGQGGDQATYRLACAVKDLGVTRDQAVFLLDEFWNERCTPPWSLGELAAKVAHAYRYGQEPVGSAAPEAAFPPEPPAPPVAADVDAPIPEMNKHYAFTPAGGGHIIWETTNPKGAEVVKHLDLNTFHLMHASLKLRHGDKATAVTKLWLADPRRRTYDGFVFAPQQDRGPRWYNLWRGFAFEPAASAEHPAVAALLEHIKENVCNNEPSLFRWLMGFFAHMIQRPWEKHSVAVVFKGGKGTGKNVVAGRIGRLLGGHFLLTSKKRYLVGQFNGHLENCLCLVLDEAFWSGDKEAEGVLKDLISGDEHLIEHKGKEAFTVDNLTRIIIIGNERWVVPASQDERRFAVFTMGDKRQNDRAFFLAMKKGMEAGGYRALLRHLMDFDLTGLDFSEAPNTQGLMEQKLQSLEPMQQWWYECLSSGQLAGAEFTAEWPEEVPTNRLRDAMERWCFKQRIHSRLPNDTHFGRALSAMAPHFTKHKTTAAKRQPGDTSNHYCTPGLELLRTDFESYLGGTIEWLD